MGEFSISFFFLDKPINTCTCTHVQNAVSLTENTYALNLLGKEVRLWGLEKGNGGIICVVAVQEQIWTYASGYT